MMANIRQVADASGVSTATVSKFLNGVKVKEKNRVAIEGAILKLNFKVNQIARGLRTNKSMTIGVLIPELDNLFATSIVSIVENILIENGYSTIICDYKTNAILEVKKLDFLIDKMVDGIITIPYYQTAENLENIDVPIVLIDRMVENSDCDCILIDNEEASYKATNYLIENGHKSIAILCGNTEIYTTKERYNGYIKALNENHIKVNSEYVLFGNYDVKTGYDLTNMLINMKNRPTAIFATNNEMTIGAMIALNEQNIDIPNEISFVGFDNLELAKAVKPKLSIITQPTEKIGEVAAHTIIARINGEVSTEKTVKLATNLVKQGSVKNINNN
jgi:LacI family transcriptional regulator